MSMMYCRLSASQNSSSCSEQMSSRCTDEVAAVVGVSVSRANSTCRPCVLSDCYLW